LPSPVHNSPSPQPSTGLGVSPRCALVRDLRLVTSRYPIINCHTALCELANDGDNGRPCINAILLRNIFDRAAGKSPSERVFQSAGVAPKAAPSASRQPIAHSPALGRENVRHRRPSQPFLPHREMCRIFVYCL